MTDPIECPPASTQYLHHVRIKGSLETLNYRRSCLTLFAVFLWLSPRFIFRFVITDSTHFPVPGSLNPERTKAGHSYLVTALPLPVSFPSLSLLFSRDQMGGFSYEFCVMSFLFLTTDQIKDSLGFDMLCAVGRNLEKILSQENNLAPRAFSCCIVRFLTSRAEYSLLFLLAYLLL